MHDPNCIFCKIIEGQLPAHVVYQDERVLAFLDIHPITAGHTLVVPKVHEPDFYKLEAPYYLALMQSAKQLAAALNTAENPEKVGVMISGFNVPHAHLHLVPMHHPDDITSRAYVHGIAALRKADPELALVSQRLQQALKPSL